MPDAARCFSPGWETLQAAPKLVPVPLTHAETDAHRARISNAEMSDLKRTVISWTLSKHEG